MLVCESHQGMCGNEATHLVVGDEGHQLTCQEHLDECETDCWSHSKTTKVYRITLTPVKG